MASKITPDPVHVMEGDMPESSMGRQPQRTTINRNSLNNVLECMTQILQQISTIQMNLLELGKEDIQPVMLLPRVPNEVVQEFQGCLSTCNCARLLEMVNEFPAQLFLQTCDKFESRSALHVAVLEGSQILIDALSKKLKALFGGNDLKSAEHEFILKGDTYELSAPNMAALIGNKEIISCFEKSLGFQMDFTEGSYPFRRSPTSGDEKRNLLEKAFPLLEKQAPTSSDQGTEQLSIREWLLKNDVDFVYCLHEAAMDFSPSQKRALEFVKFVCDNGDSYFLEPLLNVQDNLGKSPWHVHPYNGNPTRFKALFGILVTHFPNLDLNMPDFSGRTPLHLAAAQGDVDVVTILTSQNQTNLNATYDKFCGCFVEQDTNFNGGQVANVTPLHLAVIHNHVGVVEILLKVPERRGLDINAICDRDVKFSDYEPDNDINKWSPFQLAAYMGYERILKLFLKEPRLYDPGLKNGQGSAPKDHNMIPALHLAASQIHPSAVKALVDCRRMDILVKDKRKNTALHYIAMHARGQSQVHANLSDYVSMFNFESIPPTSRKPSNHGIITCLDILMQSGLDMEQKNIYGMVPTFHPSCPENVQVWWLEKMAKETQENKNNLITAANAISVTAALVATASFVGPLQPPLGILDDGNQTWLDGYSQVKHTSVQVFLFCDSLSFYLAIAAIVFAMLPSWPIPHEGLAQEVRIARRCVQVAVLLLFGSIIFVVCAFSAASIAIVPDQLWRYKTIVVIPTSLGVLICFLILFLSFMRLLTLISSKSEFAKKISNVATQIMLWEQDTSFC